MLILENTREKASVSVRVGRVGVGRSGDGILYARQSIKSVSSPVQIECDSSNGQLFGWLGITRQHLQFCQLKFGNLQVEVEAELPEFIYTDCWEPIMAANLLYLQPIRYSSRSLQQRSCVPSNKTISAFSTNNKKSILFAQNDYYTSSSNNDKNTLIWQPLLYPVNPNLKRCLKVRSHLNLPLISPQDQWGTWTALFAAGAFGIW